MSIYGKLIGCITIKFEKWGGGEQKKKSEIDSLDNNLFLWLYMLLASIPVENEYSES